MHPHEAASFDAARDIPRIREHLSRGAVAIGECGLDYHYDNAPRDVQRSVFSAQLALASELGQPLIVHTREAVEDTAAMVREAGEAKVRGVLHCFTGPAFLAEVAMDAGWFVSFSGVITFKKWADDGLIRSIPEDRFLVESDPYLAPVPFRGKRNESSFVVLTVQKVAATRGVDAAVVGRNAVRNAARLFGLAGLDSGP
jgi:TatD DNase family protein